MWIPAFSCRLLYRSGSSHIDVRRSFQVLVAQDFLDGLVRYAHAVEVGRQSAPEAVPAKPQDPVLVQLERMLQFLIVVIDPAVPTLLA
jgi:hypothetical protein